MVKGINILLLSMTMLHTGTASPRFSGYVENTTAIYNDEEHTWTDVASGRLEGSWDYKDRGGVELHGIVTAALQPLDPFMLMHDSSVTNRIIAGGLDDFLTASLSSLDTSSLTWKNIDDLLVRLSESSRNASDLEPFIRHLPYTSFYPRNSIILDRALVKFYFKRVDLFIGRQMIGWGTGYAWNPTDVWNKKNPTDPTAPKTGINALRAEIPLGDLSGLSLVLSPGTGIDQTSGGARLKGTIGGYDISLSLIRMYTPDAALLGLPERVMLGGDAAGQIGDIGVFAEAALVNPRSEHRKYTDTDRLYAQTDIGCYYTFENGLYLIGEYYFNRLGAADRNNYDLTHLLHLLNGDMAGMGRHYGFAGLTKDFLRYWQIVFYVLGNIGDRSAMLLPSIEYSHTENIAVKLGGSFGIGDERTTEFGGVHHSGMLTVTGYF
jgi:hypothetical protein